MVATFPHMGNAYILVKTLFEKFGTKYIIPPVSSKKTLEIGSKNSPETACEPLKLNIGNLVEAIGQGADTVVMVGGCGPCRAGYYAEMHREILDDMGLAVEIVTLEIDASGIKGLIGKLRKLFPGAPLISIARGFFTGYRALCAADKLDKLSYYVRPRELQKGATDRIMRNFEKEMRQVKGVRGIFGVIKRTEEALRGVRLDDTADPLRIGIVGEIFTLVEPFSNMEIERTLGNMGIEIDRSLTVSKYIDEHIIRVGLGLPKKKEPAKAAYPYIKTMIGGHARETVGNTVLYARKGYDGVIEVYPLTCMPEIVANSILPAVSKDYKIPILTLVMDEMSGEAGVQTRIDAFADMLLRKREKNHELVLSRN